MGLMRKKMQLIKLILVVICSFILSGCAGASDYHIDLPGNYSLISTSDYQVTINEKNEIEGSWKSSPVIPAKIVEMAYDENYVLVKQLGLKRRNPNDSSDTYEIPDETKINYWILDTALGIARGPVSENEFYEKKIEFSISDEIQLKSVSSYKDKE